jgi:predicted ATPase/DNA-binding SARP family transcriptional activator
MAAGVQLLGTVAAVVDGQEVPLTAQHRLLLARLAISNDAVTTDELRELLGSVDSPVTVSTVKSHTSRLRACLGDSDCIRATPGGYRLVLGPGQVDRDRFEELLASAAGAPPAVAARRLADALALWQGPALGDLAGEPFALPEAVRLEELRLQAVEARAAAQLALGRHDEVVTELERLTRVEPLRERLHCQLAHALAGLGRQADALRVLDRLRRALAEETGLTPNDDVLQLEHRILSTDPALSPASSRVGMRVPQPTTPLVGRLDEVGNLVGAIQDRRLVVLVGLGGVGKTRLALGASSAATDAFGSGTVHLDLARAVDDDAVVPLLADACRLPARSVDEHVTLLGDQHVLVVLDGCEHVLDGVRSVITAILSSAPSVHVLATSRVVLGIAGEQTVRVRGLPVDDGIELLVARAADAGVVVDPADAAVRELCRALDGLPLAIELAAPRLGHLSPSELLAGLDGRFELLRSDLEGRHASLLALLDGAVHDLSESHRWVLDAAGTFMGSFSADAVGHVAGGVDARETLGELIRRSLVVASPGDSPTFRLLDTVRAHARTRAVASEDERLWRHANWYVEQTTALDDARAALSSTHATEVRRWQPDIELAIRTLLERDERVRAARLLTGTAALWRNGSGAHFDFARAALEEVLASPLPPEIAVGCHGLAAFLARMQVDSNGARRHARAGTEIDSASGWVPWCWGALAHRLAAEGSATGSTETVDEARQAAEVAATLATKVDPAWRLPIAWDVANVAFTLGDIHAAHTSLAAALAIAGGADDLVAEEVLVRACDAAALHLLARDRDAYELACSALALSEGRADTGGGWLAKQPLAFLAPALAAAGEPRRAIALLLDTLPSAAKVASVLNVSDFVVSLAVVHAIQDEWETAGRLLGAARALGLRHSIPFRTPMGYALYRHWNGRLREAMGAERGRSAREQGASLGFAAILASIETLPTIREGASRR